MVDMGAVLELDEGDVEEGCRFCEEDISERQIMHR